MTAVQFPWSTAHLYTLTHMLHDIHSRNVDAISCPASYLYQSLWPSAQGTIIPGHSAFGMLVTVVLVGGGDVARQWTPETALSRCCWLSQAASSPTRRNITLSFLKCVTASGVLKTAGNTHTHTHTRTLVYRHTCACTQR